MTYVKVKGQSRSNVVKNVLLLLPTLARRITKQVKNDDDLYEGQRSTEVISGQGTCHHDDTVMSSLYYISVTLHQILGTNRGILFSNYSHDQSWNIYNIKQIDTGLSQKPVHIAMWNWICCIALCDFISFVWKIL